MYLSMILLVAHNRVGDARGTRNKAGHPMLEQMKQAARKHELELAAQNL